ncbi:HEAT repeat domain-containing protein [Actinoplanes sp. NPDC049668]|uniref:HEAT repeat domain-containing protein n=1 Tax=unclassified Actinoplanes TaxID=2626549 RepID=UPI0033B99E48
MASSVDVLAGLDEVAWESMTHAYGAATDVPAGLRGLVDADPAVREAALDFMYGSVHHQGDIYDSTLAAVPFLLRVAADRRPPGRAAVVELLAGIGNAEHAGALTGQEARAGAAVGAAYPIFIDLLTDRAPAVRAATCTALLACRDRPAQARAALRRHFDEEPDAGVRAAVVAAAAELARRAGDGAATGTWLAEVLADDPDHGVRAAALTQAMTLTEHGGPPVDVETALALLAQHGTGPRRRRADLGELVIGLSNSMGDRLGARMDLLVALLRSPDRKRRESGVPAAGYLVNCWRADYAPLAALVAEQVTGGRAAARAGACQALGMMDVHAAPAADALVAALMSADRIVPDSARDAKAAWVVASGSGAVVGPALSALAGTGDPRALPMLAWVLETEVVPRGVGALVGRYGARAADLAPLIVRRRRELPGDDQRRPDLIDALIRIGPAAAETTDDLLAEPLDRGATRALGGFGPAARRAEPRLREILVTGHRVEAAFAAAAIWRVSGDDTAARQVLDRYRDDRYGKRDMTSLIATVGAPLADFAPYLRDLLQDEDFWVRMDAARALWSAAGDVDATVPVLAYGWRESADTRRATAEVLARMGPAAAPARPLLLAELRERRRCLTPVRDDEDLLSLCRTALEAIG